VLALTTLGLITSCALESPAFYTLLHVLSKGWTEVLTLTTLAASCVLVMKRLRSCAESRALKSVYPDARSASGAPRPPSNTGAGPFPTYNTGMGLPSNTGLGLPGLPSNTGVGSPAFYTLLHVLSKG